MHGDDTRAPGAEGLHAKQVNPGWAWYRIEQNGKVTAVLSAVKSPSIVEQWYYGKDYVEPGPSFPKGVGLTFVPVSEAEFNALKQQINVQRAFKHAVTPL